MFRNDTNIGPLNNWIRCAKEARGEFAKILFSDDLIYPDYLAKCLPYLESEDVGAVFSAVEVGPEAGAGETFYAWTREAGIVPSSEFVHDALFWGNVPYSPGAYLFRLSDVQRFLVPHPSYSVGERYTSQGMGPDLGLCLLTACAYPLVAHVPDVLGLFRDHAGSFTQSSMSETRFWNYNRVRKAILDQTGEKKQTRRWLAWSWMVSMAASHRPLRLSAHLDDFGTTTAGFKPKLRDIFWGATVGMLPLLVRYSRHFRILSALGSRRSTPLRKSDVSE